MLARILLASALVGALAGVSSALADDYYFVKTYSGDPQPPYPWLEAEVMQVSSDSACDAPDGYTGVALSELHDLGFASPSEVYDTAVSENTAWSDAATGWNYANYFLRDSVGFMKRICCGSKVWSTWPRLLGLACKTWERAHGSGQPYVMIREQQRIVRFAVQINSYGRWVYPYNYTLDWKQEGWFDDGNIQHQVYLASYTTW
jgi:hypothetical protein